MHPSTLMLSNVSSEKFFEFLGEDGRAEVTAYPKNSSAEVAREFQRVLKGVQSPPPLAYSTLEGFVIGEKGAILH